MIDAWYDSGAMPFAQWGAPHIDEERFRATYPAQFICEGIDQTRGWFYSLMAVGTLVFGRSPYENVLCLGLILAEDGRKMSKHLGNVMEPMPLMDRHGADALRWFMAAAGSPWSARRINHEQLDEIVRKVLLTYWNTVSFFALYAAAGGWTPDREAPPPAERPLLDRWVRSELYQVAAEVEGALEDFDPVRACRALSRFIDDLSNWYVRRSRRRFWQGAATSDGASAFATLYESLEVLTRLLAPVVPFLSDHVWSLLRVPEAPDSVHLATWPTVPEGAVDEELSTWMRLVRRIVELGRAARVSNGVRVRQPLSRALVNAPGFASLPLSLREQIAEELNVQEVLALSETEDGGPIDIQVKPVFRALGRRYGRRTQDVARAVRSADPGWLAARIRAEGSAILHVAGVGEVEIGRDDVVVTELPRSGWSVRSADGETIALDLRLTPGLLRSGMAREAVRLIQQARKASGLNVSDRIALWWQTADEELAAALEQHTAVIAAEVLAAEVTRGRPGAALPRHTDGELGLTFWFTCV